MMTPESMTQIMRSVLAQTALFFPTVPKDLRITGRCRLGDLPIDNNWIENRIRPVTLGRSNWLFAGSLRAGQRAANIMSLIQSAKLNGHDPYCYLKDVLVRLPTHPASRIDELLPHRWAPLPITH